MMKAEPGKVEQVLQQTEDRYKLLAENVSDVIFTLDLNLRYTYCSPSVERLRGYSVDEVMAQTLDQVLTPASFEVAKKTFVEGLAQTGSLPGAPFGPQTLELELTRKEGGTVWAEVKVSFLRGQQGDVVGILGISRDITERRRTEAALRESGEMHWLLFHKSTDPVLLLDGDTYVDGNEAALRFMGCSREQLIGLHPWDVSPERQPCGRLSSHKAREIIETTLKEGSNHFEWVHRTFDGRELWADVSLTVVPVEGKSLIYALWRDIETRKKAEEALVASQVHLSAAMDLAKIVYWELDYATGTFIIDDSFYVFYGTTAEREGGHRLPAEEYGKRFIHPDDRALVQQSAQQIASGRDPEFLVDLEHRIIRRDGEVRRILTRTRGFRDSDGRITRCYGANQDITERKRAEEEKEALEFQLRQAQKMEAIGTFSAGIAHDFRNILVAIEGFANLGRAGMDGGKTKGYLDRISRAVERGKELVGQILAFSHGGEDRAKPTDLVPVVKESVRMLRASLHPTITIREHLGNESLVTLADPTQVQQIIMNLATNAAHAMGRRGGTLTVELSDFNPASPEVSIPDLRSGPYLRLRVSDTGTGMDAQTAERVFDPFFTKKKRTEGTGLGLWVVHSIVKKHGGVIKVRSALGEGSTFDVFLPRVTCKSDDL